jgi:hypothetical protein
MTRMTTNTPHPSPLPFKGRERGEGKEILVETIVNRVELDTSMKFK